MEKLSMKKQEQIEEWLRRAESNLERARAGKMSDKVLYEDICFDCQQSVEKALKGLLVSFEIDFPYTHAISKLITLIESLGIDVPEKVKKSVVLSIYAMDARYPGYGESIGEEGYKEALELAEHVYNWVVEMLNR